MRLSEPEVLFLKTMGTAMSRRDACGSCGEPLADGRRIASRDYVTGDPFDVAICRSLHVHPVQTGTTAVCVRDLWTYECGGRRLVAYRF